MEDADGGETELRRSSYATIVIGTTEAAVVSDTPRAIPLPPWLLSSSLTPAQLDHVIFLKDLDLGLTVNELVALGQCHVSAAPSYFNQTARSTAGKNGEHKTGDQRNIMAVVGKSKKSSSSRISKARTLAVRKRKQRIHEAAKVVGHVNQLSSSNMVSEKIEEQPEPKKEAITNEVHELFTSKDLSEKEVTTEEQQQQVLVIGKDEQLSTSNDVSGEQDITEKQHPVVTTRSKVCVAISTSKNPIQCNVELLTQKQEEDTTERTTTTTITAPTIAAAASRRNKFTVPIQDTLHFSISNWEPSDSHEMFELLKKYQLQHNVGFRPQISKDKKNIRLLLWGSNSYVNVPLVKKKMYYWFIQHGHIPIHPQTSKSSTITVPAANDNEQIKPQSDIVSSILQKQQEAAKATNKPIQIVPPQCKISIHPAPAVPAAAESIPRKDLFYKGPKRFSKSRRAIRREKWRMRKEQQPMPLSDITFPPSWKQELHQIKFGLRNRNGTFVNPNSNTFHRPQLSSRWSHNKFHPAHPSQLMNNNFNNRKYTKFHHTHPSQRINNNEYEPSQHSPDFVNYNNGYESFEYPPPPSIPNFVNSFVLDYVPPPTVYRTIRGDAPWASSANKSHTYSNSHDQQNSIFLPPPRHIFNNYYGPLRPPTTPSTTPSPPFPNT